MLPQPELLLLLDAPAAAGPSLVESLLPIVAIGLIMYFLIIRPQQQERRNHEQLLAALQRDDRVVTTSGMHGRIVEVKDKSFVVEVADKVRIEFDKTAVARRADAPAPAAS
jgi:preprotein translocase subunit YajC